ncbi:MAG: HAD-IIA family hydrolase [Bacteroidota bacterium]
MRELQGFIFDLDGTVYLSERLIPGAAETIGTLRNQGKRTAFLSNKPIESREHYAAKLTRLGIPTEAEDIINSSLVMARYIADHAPGAAVYCLGEQPLRDELAGAGLRVTADPKQAAFLVVAFDRTFDYGKLNDALIAVKNGARFVATNPDRTCPVDGGEIPDCAGMIGAVAGVTGKQPEIIVGKPNPLMLQTILARMELSAADCLMVGDRLDTDIVMGLDAGMPTALVLTGATSREQLDGSHVRPHFVLDSIADLIPMLRRGL